MAFWLPAQRARRMSTARLSSLEGSPRRPRLSVPILGFRSDPSFGLQRKKERPLGEGPLLPGGSRTEPMLQTLLGNSRGPPSEADSAGEVAASSGPCLMGFMSGWMGSAQANGDPPQLAVGADDNRTVSKGSTATLGSSAVAGEDGGGGGEAYERWGLQHQQEPTPRPEPVGLLGVLRGNLLLSVLLVFLPIGFALKWSDQPATMTFTTNFLGVIPLAWLIGKSTEDLAAVTGEVVGGLLNATFGNVVEMMLCVASIRSGQLVITKCTLLGSILSNLLLVMGCSCLFGGLSSMMHQRRHQQPGCNGAAGAASLLRAQSSGFGARAESAAAVQTFTEQGAYVQVVMLLLSVMVLSMPTAYADTMMDVDDSLEDTVVKMSRYLSVLLLLSYVLYLVFQMVSHKDLFGSDEEEDGEPDMGPRTAAIVLAVCTATCSLASDYLIDALRPAISSWGLPQEFVGIILLPIIGNAAEHYTAVTVALVDKMDLALGVAVGSSCQMALLVSPFTVVVGWVAGVKMSLDFHSFQLVVLFGSVLVVGGVLWSKQTHWLYGAMMIIAYLAVAICYLSESPNVSTFQDRSPGPKQPTR